MNMPVAQDLHILAVMQNRFPKVCALCQASHDEEGWKSLHFVGHQESEEELLEMRDCFCGNTLCLVAATYAPDALETTNGQLHILAAKA